MTLSRLRNYEILKVSSAIIAFVLLSLLLLTDILAADAKNSDLIGKWNGTLIGDDQNRIPVDLTVELKDGSLQCELDYGPNRNCTSDAVSAGSKDNVFYFRFNRGHGGWCDKLTDGEMTLQVKNDRTLHLRVKHKNIDESVELKKVDLE